MGLASKSRVGLQGLPNLHLETVLTHELHPCNRQLCPPSLDFMIRNQSSMIQLGSCLLLTLGSTEADLKSMFPGSKLITIFPHPSELLCNTYFPEHE